MPRRPSDRLVCCAVTPLEREYVDEMKAKSGIASDQNLMRLAFERLAAWYDLDIPAGVFMLREHLTPKQQKQAKARLDS